MLCQRGKRGARFMNERSIYLAKSVYKMVDCLWLVTYLTTVCDWSFITPISHMRLIWCKSSNWRENWRRRKLKRKMVVWWSWKRWRLSRLFSQWSKRINSSQFLRLSRKGDDRFEWTGDMKHLDKFFAALHYKRIWSEPKGEGNPHQFTNKDFTCIWYAATKSLLMQGKKSKDLVDKLKHVVDHPVPLTTAEDESKHLAEPGYRADEICMAKAIRPKKNAKMVTEHLRSKKRKR